VKIEFALTGYLPEVFGGAEVYTRNLAKALSNKGHDVSISALDFKHRRGRPVFGAFDGIPVYKFSYDFPYRPAPFYAIQFYPELYREATNRLEKQKPDVIHITNGWHMWAFSMAALDLGIPVVATHVDFLWFCKESHFLKTDFSICSNHDLSNCRECHQDLTDSQWEAVASYKDGLRDLFAKGYSFHHCPCPFMEELILGLDVDKSKVGYWPYGVNINSQKYDAPTKKADKLRLGFVGRWNRIKGIDVLLKAMERVPKDVPVELFIFGEQETWNKDPFTAKLFEKANYLSNVILKGRFMPDQVGVIFQEIDCLVLPSIWHENSPISILESQAFSTPVICSDGLGMTNLIQDKINGLHFKMGDADDLAEKITTLTYSDDLLKQITEGSRPFGNIEDSAIKFETIYRKAKAPENSKWKKASKAFSDAMISINEVFLAEQSKLKEIGN